MEYYRVLAIDYGSRRIGLALSDPMRISGRPFDVIDNEGIDFVIDSIVRVVRENQVGLVVLGLPVSVDGTDSEKTRETREFKEKLATALEVPVRWQDERYSTETAREFLVKKGQSPMERKRTIDAVAAAVILGRYLESNPA